MDKAIRILHFVPVLQAAGIENYIMNIYRSINRNKVQFDFIVHSKNKSVYDDEVEKLGGKIFRFTYKDDKKIIKYLNDLNQFFKCHPEYKIIHGNMQSMMPVYLLVGRLNHVPVLIAHSHNSNYEKSIKGYILHLLSRLSRWVSNVNFACSEEAANYLFGNSSYEFSPNAIDVNRFMFSISGKNRIRDELGIENKTIVIGHIGRFDLQKNHERIIDIFYAYKQINSDSVLILVGVGRLMEKIKDKVNNLGLLSSVKFLGLRSDTPDIYSSMDIFLFPSLYEGLPVTGVEAQTSGLPCVFSSTITKQVNITGLIKYISLDDTNEIWAKAIEEKLNILDNRERYFKEIEDSRFNIKNNSKYLQDWYLNMWKGDRNE